VFQAAMELHDEALAALCTASAEDVDRQLAWVKTRIRTTAPQALTVPPARMREVAASLPKSPTLASLPDAAWAPVAGALALGVVGVLGLLAGQPWLLPSLGPTAYLVAEMPAHPSTRVYNIVGGHLLGLAAGIVAVLLTGAWAEPVTLQAGVLTGARVGAAVLALGLTLLATLALQASHPPAGATTLLVALGPLGTTTDVVDVAIGAAIIAITGVALRRLRLGRWPRRKATHVPAVAGAPAVTQPVAPEFKKAA
jgi:CBS-domain-containing membrane protein